MIRPLFSISKFLAAEQLEEAFADSGESGSLLNEAVSELGVNLKTWSQANQSREASRKQGIEEMIVIGKRELEEKWRSRNKNVKAESCKKR